MKHFKTSLLVLFTLLAAFVSSGVFAQNCTTLWGAQVLDGKSTTGYSTPTETYTTSCTGARSTLYCNKGSFGSIGNIYKYQSCTPQVWKNCTTPVSAKHLEYKPLYSSTVSNYTNTCAALSKQFQCINGSFTGTDMNLYKQASCVDKVRKQCIDKWNNSYVDHLGTISLYTANTSTTTQTCANFKTEMQCLDGTWSGSKSTTLQATCTDLGKTSCSFTGGDGKRITIPHSGSQLLYSNNIAPFGTTCNQLTGQAICKNGVLNLSTSTYKYSSCSAGAGSSCSFTGGDGKLITISHNASKWLYSNSIAVFPKTCAQLSGQASCFNGSLNVNTFTYNYASCSAGVALNCSFTGGDGKQMTIAHGTSRLLYSTSSTTYPETCEKSSGIVSCNNGSLNNVGYYIFPQCTNGLNSKQSTIGTDLTLTASLPGSGTQIAQYANPTLNVFMINKGTNGISGSNISPGFLTCVWTEQGLTVYQSKVITQLTINAGTTLKKTIGLNNLFTQGLGDKNIVCTLRNRPGEVVTTNNTASLKLSVTDAGRFDLALNKAIDPIKDNLDAPEIRSGVAGINDFLMNKVMNILVPLIILVAILTAMFGFYKLFFATDDKAIDTGVKLIGFGVVGIIIIMSANFFATTLYKDIFLSGDLGYGSLQGYSIAQKLYEQLLFPFIKIAIYLSLGVLFVMLAARVITFVFGSDDDTKKKAGTIITWNIIGMLVIIGAKQLVEFVYGKQADVVKSVSNLGEIGSGLLATKNFPFLYQVINWAMGLSALLILVMVLFQAFQLLMKPDAPDAMKKIKNSLLYIFIGIIIIGTGYIITNFLIIN